MSNRDTLKTIDRMIPRALSYADRAAWDGMRRLFFGKGNREQLLAELRDVHLNYIAVYEECLATGFFTPTEDDTKMYELSKRMVRGDLDPNLEVYE